MLSGVVHRCGYKNKLNKGLKRMSTINTGADTRDRTGHLHITNVLVV